MKQIWALMGLCMLVACQKTSYPSNDVSLSTKPSVPKVENVDVQTSNAATKTGSASDVPVKTVNTKDLTCLTEAIYFEAKDTGKRGMRAVGEVVLNRRDDGRFPNSICGVVDQRYNGSCQFSYRCDGRPETYASRSQKNLSENIANELLSNRGSDITNGALFFHSARIPAGWFGTLSRRGQFGGNIFYR